MTLDVSDTLPLVDADPALLERVIENLVSNALRYAGPTPEAPVLVAAHAQDGVVVVSVVDHGPGLATGAAPAPSRAVGLDGSVGRADRSAGLGLAIVRGFCDAMGVTLEFRDTAGGGLTVALTLTESAR